IYAGWFGGYGNLVVIDHGNGLSTAYGHASSLAVSVGQSVSQGETVSYVGSTGHSTGPHLHLEVRVHGVPGDPPPYLEGSGRFGRCARERDRAHEVEVGERPPTLVETQPVAREELVRNREADELERQCLDETSVGTVEERDCREARRVPQRE